MSDGERLRKWPWMLAVAAFAGCASVAWYWAFDREPPRTNISGTAFGRTATPAELLDPDYIPAIGRGETFNGQWDLTVTRNCAGTAQRWVTSLADPNWVYVLPNQTLVGDEQLQPSATVPGRRRLDAPPWQVPDRAPLGEAAYQIQIAFRCNPLHWLLPIRLTYPAIRFRIVEKAAAAARNGWHSNQRTPRP